MSSDPASAVSYYRATAQAYTAYAPLDSREEVDVAIVGGGYAGLNTALGLAERGVGAVALLEAGSIGHGASGRNGGFVFAGYSLGEAALLARSGTRAPALYALTRQAVATIRQRVARYAIDCELVEQGVLWANWFRDPRPLLQRQRLLAEHYDSHWQWLSRDQLRQRLHSERYHHGLFEPDALHLHPLNYALGLAKAAAGQGVAIHEHSAALSLRREGASWRVRTVSGELRARRVVLACGGYLAGLSPPIDRAVSPIATYVMVTEPLGARLAECLSTAAAVYDSRFAFDYYRPLADGRLLWGGRISIRERSAAALRRLLLADLLRVYPQLAGVKIDYAWSGLMSYARHQMPQLGLRADGLCWAQAFGGHGLAPTVAAGELLAAALAGDDQRWRWFADYGLDRAWAPAGLLAAQASYWWQQAADRWKTMWEA